MASPPLKSVIEKAVTEYCASSRAQDRIVFVFLGHMVLLGENAFLVPLEGDFGVAESLIPLKWLYEQFEKCKARQKVLVFDTCRMDPGRGLERPGSGGIAIGTREVALPTQSKRFRNPFGVPSAEMRG